MMCVCSEGSALFHIIIGEPMTMANIHRVTGRSGPESFLAMSLSALGRFGLGCFGLSRFGLGSFRPDFFQPYASYLW